MYKKYIGKETDFQISVATYLRSINSFFTHCANEGKMNAQYGLKRKKMGVVAGVPDVLIFDRKNGFNGFAIELKCGYNKPSVEQKEFIRKLEKLGWKTLISYSLDEVVAEIDKYYK